MRTFLSIIAALIVLGLIAVAALIFWPHDRTTAEELTLSDDAMAWPETPESDRPHAATVAGDCAACHTAEGGKPYAGGRPFETPMGTVYSTNITPDPETGIGDYTLNEFRASLVDGVRADGAQLYPAMPYTNYRHLAERDVKAMYAYFMDEVEPVSMENKSAEMTFPFNLRFGVRAWNWLAVPGAGFDAPEDPQLARGAYLVEGAEHCGACHTPRNALFMQESYMDTDPSFLSGGEVEGWTVPSLRGEDGAPARWSAEALKAFLATGRNNNTATGGQMTGVIAHSLQNLPDSDLDSVVAYLRKLAPNGGGAEDEKPAPDRDRATEIWNAAASGGTSQMLASADPEKLSEGGRLYLDNCAACHMIDGKGGDGTFPELDGNTTVTAESPKGLVHTILNGAELPSTGGRPLRLAMPSFKDRLSDAQVAEIASFVRSAWSNDAAPIEAGDVAGLRE